MAAPAKRTTATKVAIPQLAWDQVRPAPVVLISGTESVLADRSIRLLRDILKAEDPASNREPVSSRPQRPFDGGAVLVVVIRPVVL